MGPNSTPQISHAKWLRETYVARSRRSSDMRRLDKAIKDYEDGIRNFYKAAGLYQQKAMMMGTDSGLKAREKHLLTEIKAALSTWKASKGIGWPNSSRNRLRAISRLDTQLNQVLPLYGRSLFAPPGQAFADNSRTGILYFLSKSTTTGMPTDPAGLLNDAAFAGSDIQYLRTVAKTHSPMEIANTLGNNDTSTSSVANSVNNIGALNELNSAILAWLNEKIGSAASEVARYLAAHLLPAIPRIIGEICAGVVSHLGHVVGIGKNFVRAIRAYATYRHRGELERGILSGHPATIISSVYGQIKDDMKSAGKQILKSSLLMALDFAAVGAGTVVNAFVSVIEFVYGIYERMKNTFKLRRLIGEARVKDDKWTDADTFQTWFQHAIADLPILSCYCLAMPMTGSYLGFLSATSTNGTGLTYHQLQRNNQTFKDVKAKAKNFISNNDIKITSTDAMVSQSLKIAQGGSVVIDDKDNEYDGNQYRKFVKNIGRNLTVGLIETQAKNKLYGW